MALILPNQLLVLNAYALLVDETPGNTAYVDHQAFMSANKSASDPDGSNAYASALDSIFVKSTNASLATKMLANLGLSAIFTQAQGEAYLAANSSNRVGAMLDLASLLVDYSGADASLVAAQTAYVATLNDSYAYSSNTSNLAGASLSDDGTVTTTFELTAGTDRVTGTSAADFFEAFLSQNSTAGGVSNTLSSADTIHGGAGTDSLYAEIVPEFFGTTGDRQIDIQPDTTSVENVEFEAREFGSNDSDTALVTVDAKWMSGINRIGSTFSDADLKIENLTTLTDSGAARDTESLTITMDHTDNDNTDGDASDLTVLLDDDYILSGTSVTGASLTIRMLNAVNNVEGENPIEGTVGFEFLVGAETVQIDIADIAADATLDYETAYDEVVAAINAQLLADGFTTVTAAKLPLANALFSIPVESSAASYDVGDDAGDYYPIILTNSGPETLAKGQFLTTALEYDTDQNNSMSTVAPVTNDNPVTINVELDKVGRAGDGGYLDIGSKDRDNGPGIEVFNVAVLGDEDRPSDLAYIVSDREELKTINIFTHADDVAGTTHASLTVRGEALFTGEDDQFQDTFALTAPFGGGNELVDADDFLGDLYLGIDSDPDGNMGELGVALDNLDVLTALGGGDIHYNAEIDGAELSNFSYTTGAGDDVAIVDLNGDAVDTVNTGLAITTGAGDDTVTVTGEDDVSDATTLGLENLTISTGTGHDHINVNAEHIYIVTAGADSDYVRVDANDSTTNGRTGIWTIGDGTDAVGADWFTRVLYEAELTIDFAGFEQTVTIETNAAGNFIATQADINAAVIAAIAANDELSHMLTATTSTGTDGSQRLTIVSNVQGFNDLTIQVVQPTIVPAATATAGETTIAGSEYAALEAGFHETEASFENGVEFDSDVIDGINTEADIISVFDGSWDGVNNAASITGNLNQTGASAVAPDFVLDSDDGTDGTDNTDADSRAIIDMGTGAHDLVALDSDRDSVDTVVFSSSWNKVSIVNFDGTTTGDAPAAEVQTLTFGQAGDIVGNGQITVNIPGNPPFITNAATAITTGETAAQVATKVATLITGAIGVASVAAVNGVVTITYTATGDVAQATVTENIVTDAEFADSIGATTDVMDAAITTGGTDASGVVAAVAEAFTLDFTRTAPLAVGNTLIFDGVSTVLADTDGNSAIDDFEIAQQIAAGAYTNFTVTGTNFSLGQVSFVANTAGALVDIADGDITGTGAGNVTVTNVFATQGAALVAAQVDVPAVQTITVTKGADQDGAVNITTSNASYDIAVTFGNARDVALEIAASLQATAEIATATVGAVDSIITLTWAAGFGAETAVQVLDGAVKTATVEATTTQGSLGDFTANGDILDFTFWLNDQTSTSGSTASAIDTARSVFYSPAGSDFVLLSNELTIVNDFAQVGTDTWASMTAADVDAALEGEVDAYANFINGGSTAVADPADQLGTGLSSVLMVENDLNAGEYKVFSVETNAAAANGVEFTVALIGTIDFGAEQTTITVLNLA